MVLRFVHDHNDKVIGTLVALFLVTSILLLIRSIGEKSEGGSSGSSVDVKDIEGAMKRVLASQPVSVTVAAGAQSAAPVESSGETGGDGGIEVARLQESLNAKERKIVELMHELDSARADLDAKSASGGGGGDGAGLQAKVEELQARLAEYEIIEDDIADLSLFKEENTRLKEEVERLKADLANAASAPAPVSRVKAENEAVLKFEKADKFELDPDDDVMKAFAEAAGGGPAPAAPAPAPEAALKFEAAETFALDPNDDIMKQFAAAVEDQTAPPPPTATSLSQEDAAAVLDAAAAAAPADDPQAAIDAMFAAAQSAAPAPAPAPAAPAPAPADDPQAAIDAMFAAAQSEAPPAPKAEPKPAPVDDPQAAIDAMFAAAQETPQAETKPSAPVAPAVADDDDPLAGILDTEKMLSEVENLDAVAAEEEEDVLAAALDTDKLLAEVGSLEAAPTAAKPPAEEAKPAAKQNNVVDISPVDDLLAEFKDAKGG